MCNTLDSHLSPRTTACVLDRCLFYSSWECLNLNSWNLNSLKFRKTFFNHRLILLYNVLNWRVHFTVWLVTVFFVKLELGYNLVSSRPCSLNWLTRLSASLLVDILNLWLEIGTLQWDLSILFFIHRLTQCFKSFVAFMPVYPVHWTKLLMKD